MPSMLGLSGRLWGREGARAPVSPAAHRCQRPLSAVRTGDPETTARTTRCHLSRYRRHGRAAAWLPYALPSRMSSTPAHPVSVSALPTLPSALAHRRARHEASAVTPRGIEVADEQETRPDQEHGAGIRLDCRRRASVLNTPVAVSPARAPSAAAGKAVAEAGREDVADYALEWAMSTLWRARREHHSRSGPP